MLTSSMRSQPSWHVEYGVVEPFHTVLVGALRDGAAAVVVGAREDHKAANNPLRASAGRLVHLAALGRLVRLERVLQELVSPQAEFLVRALVGEVPALQLVWCLRPLPPVEPAHLGGDRLDQVAKLLLARPEEARLLQQRPPTLCGALLRHVGSPYHRRAGNTAVLCLAKLALLGGGRRVVLPPKHAQQLLERQLLRNVLDL
eukprot:CAMPEP_0196702704 /NCGR_PEP_ID=MMETSP1090-20130531/54224_1 /TAXON_ID=37098 /ORGANISM="Isochrysis sp, Strain CCMP1244" /LENGTH=201 /DNA_ID=CAMNT_0042042535 /DNA_START=96 /DNA_END=701 /DNA_ORIENTATION=+